MIIKNDIYRMYVFFIHIDADIGGSGKAPTEDIWSSSIFIGYLLHKVLFERIFCHDIVKDL